MKNATHQTEGVKFATAIKTSNKNYQPTANAAKDAENKSLQYNIELCRLTLNIKNQYDKNAKSIKTELKDRGHTKDYFSAFVREFICKVYKHTTIMAHLRHGKNFDGYTNEEIIELSKELNTTNYEKIGNHILKLKNTSETEVNNEPPKPVGERKNAQKKAINKVGEKIFGAEFQDDAVIQVLVQMMKKYDESKFDKLVKKGKSEVYSK